MTGAGAMIGAGSPAVHLVHGMGTDMAAPSWPAITAEEAATVVAQFPAAGPLEHVHWHSPRPFSAAALIETGQGMFLLKRHHRRMRTPDQLGAEHRFIAHLRTRITVPEVMTLAASDSGALARGDWTYELHRKAPGVDLYRDRPSWTPFLSLAQARAAGVALAQLHRASQGFDAPARPPQPLVASFTILPDPDPIAAAERYVAARPALAAFLAPRPWRRELASLFSALGDGLQPRLAAQPALWTHNDWHPSNLLWEAEEVRTVIDFGLADRTCALHDLAIAIERSGVAWLALGQGADAAIGQPEAACALLAGYAATTAFGAEDRATLVRLLPLVHLEFALSEVAYFAGVLGDMSAAALAWDGYLIGHAAWFLSEPGQAFLRRIADAEHGA